MYEKSVADVEYMGGNYASAAAMYLEGARDGGEVDVQPVGEFTLRRQAGSTRDGS